MRNAFLLAFLLAACSPSSSSNNSSGIYLPGAMSAVPPPVATDNDLPPVPGAIDPKITQDNIKTTICVSGYTATVRPPASYTNKLKLEQMAKLGLSGKPSDYEEDHLISLEIGGNPTDPNNLWPEPYQGQWNARAKDQLEDKLHRMVCGGQTMLGEAQVEIRSNWILAYQKYVQ